MEVYKIESNGEKYEFNVIKNSTIPCPQCGVPACGKEDILWFEEDHKRKAIIFDGSYFDLAGEEFFNKNIKSIVYDSLPEFMKEWNESRGWEDCWDYDGYEIDIDDFLKSLELLKTCEMGKWITKEDITAMENLAIEAKVKGKKLKIVRG
jgi:hypothetical protein